MTEWRARRLPQRVRTRDVPEDPRARTQWLVTDGDRVSRCCAACCVPPNVGLQWLYRSFGCLHTDHPVMACLLTSLGRTFEDESRCAADPSTYRPGVLIEAGQVDAMAMPVDPGVEAPDPGWFDLEPLPAFALAARR